jgi:hypothetical protein
MALTLLSFDKSVNAAAGAAAAAADRLLLLALYLVAQGVWGLVFRGWHLARFVYPARGEERPVRFSA